MTTGQPIKVPSDRNKYNNEFMENLRLQIKLNDANLQANRLYTNTGQLPPSVQMADTRSTSEKLADVEGLKKSIVADLSPVAETSFAYAIIEGVLKSPLNIDNSLFRYLAQNAPQLGQQLSKKYKFGIAGDANDVEIIVQFLEDAFNKTRNTFQTIKGYMNSSTNLRSNNTNLQDQIISEFKYFLQRLYQIEKYSLERYGNMPNLIELFNTVKYIISDILLNLPNQQQMNQILQDMTNHSLTNNPYANIARDPMSTQDEDEFYASQMNLYGETRETKYAENVIKMVIEMIEKLPNPDSVRTILNIMEKAFKTNSENMVLQCIDSLSQLFTEWIESDINNPTPFQQALRVFRGWFLTQANQEIAQQTDLNRIQTIQHIKDQQEQNVRNAKAQRVYVINPDDDPVPVAEFPIGTVNSSNRNVGDASTISTKSTRGSIDDISLRSPIQGNSPQYSQYDEYSQRSGASNNTNLSWNSQNSYPINGNVITLPPNAQEDLLQNYRRGVYPQSEESSLQSYLHDAPSVVSGQNPSFADISSGRRPPPDIPEKSKYQKVLDKDKQVYDTMKEEYKRNPYWGNDKKKLWGILNSVQPAQTANDPEFSEFYGQEIEPSREIYVDPNIDPDYPPNNPSKKAIHFDEYLKLKRHHIKHHDSSFSKRDITPEQHDKVIERVNKMIQDGMKHQIPIDQLNQDIRNMEDAYFSQKSGKGLKKGRGLSSDYRDFGINKINHKKLDDGILTLRRQSNSNIPDMPSKRISRKLQKIIKHISGGGMPDFNEINNLENHEKDYLHKLVSKSNLTDRLSVPAPSKDQEERDFHQFEVMKGEIMSGNDSKELVKKFKILILKLSKQNILPKNEVNELLQDLLTLGY